jgi:hydrophobe/amphiphile efflux-3 (HAE3) family protein
MKKIVNNIKNFSAYVITYPKVTITLCFLITALFATQLPKLTINASINGIFFPDFLAKRALDKLQNLFGGSEIVLLGIVTDNIYSPRILKKIQRLTKEIDAMEETDKVISLFTVYDMIGTEKGMKVSKLIEKIPETEKDVKALRARLRSNPMIWNKIISEDEMMTAIIATLTPGAKDDIVYEKFQAIQKRETKTAESEEGGGFRLQGRLHPSHSSVEFHLGGMPINRALLALNTRRNIKMFLLYGVLVMVILLYFSFRSLRSILLPFTVVIMSSICTLGFMAFLEKEMSLTGIIIPVMLLAIATDYSIHLIARYDEDVHADLALQSPHLLSTKKGISSSVEAIVEQGMRRLSVPILLVGVTTVAGFSALLIHIMPLVQNLEIFASFGIITASILSITFVPAWLVVLPIPRVLLQKEYKERLGNILNYLTKHPLIPKIVVVTSLLIALVFLAGIPKIIVHTDSMKYYEEGYPLVVSTKLFDKKLGGTTTIDIMFDGDIKNPDVLKQMQELQEYMDSLPTIGKTLSVVDFLKKMNQAMHRNDPTYYTIPETRELIDQYLSRYFMSGGSSDLHSVVDREYRKAHLIGYVNVTGIPEMAKTIKRVEEYVAKHFANVNTPKVETITGFPVLLKELMPLVVRGLRHSFLLALIIIFVMTALAFRSFVAGLLSVYPLLVTMIIVFGLMGYWGIELSLTIAMFSSILVGVGVDYTIHFLFHYREALRHWKQTPYQALEATLNTSGKGILSHALSVMLGFSVFMFSTFLPVYSFGWLLTFSIFACLIGALVLLPSAVLVFKPKFIFSA